jgi:acetyl-CoA synthetase
MPHPSQGETAKAFIQLKEGHEATEDLKQDIIEYSKSQLIPYARPRSIEFIDKMPMTNVGKVSFRELEKRERGKSG